MSLSYQKIINMYFECWCLFFVDRFRPVDSTDSWRFFDLGSRLFVGFSFTGVSEYMGYYSLPCYSKYIFELMNLGKGELLAWINDLIEAEYMSVEMLGDGIAYAQVLDAIHPGCIALSRMNYTPKYADDNLRNLRIVEDSLKKLRINQPASFQKMAKGMFQDNIVFLQWLYSYARKNGNQQMMEYLGYEKRVRMLQRQGKSKNQMNIHLVPTQRYQQQWQAGQQVNEEIEIDPNMVEGRIQGVESYVYALQNDLKDMMELNWRKMFNIDRSIEERNSYYNLLVSISKMIENEPPSMLKSKLMDIIGEMPIEYQ